MHTARQAFIPALLIAGLLFALAATGCSSPTEPGDPPDTSGINEDIVKVSTACEEGNAQFIMGDWTDRQIYATKSVTVFGLNDSLRSDRCTELFEWEGDGRPINYIELNETGTRLLVVRSFPADVSIGSLHEYNLQSEGKPKPSELPVLRDSTYAVSSAVYLPGSNGEKVIYYSYGSVPELDNDGPTPGYYLLNTDTGKDSLLVEHRSPAGPEEIFNGFDVRPDGQTLLYPINYDNVRESRSPTVVRYDLKTATPDTLSWRFRPQFLWLRYSPSGSQLLYGIYQEEAFRSSSGRVDSIGVIDLPTGARRSLNTRTHPEEEESMDLFPRWGPSGQHVVYGSAPVEDRGAVGPFSLYVLKNVN
jgi:hypothetical protein